MTKNGFADASKQFSTGSQGFDTMSRDIAAGANGSPFAADVAGVMGNASRDYGYAAYVADSAHSSKNQADFQQLSGDANWYVKNHSSKALATLKGLRGAHRLEINAASAYGASAMLMGLAHALDAHINTQRTGIANAQAQLAGLRGRAGGLGLSLATAPDPSGALGQLAIQRDRTSSLAASTLQVAADFFGLDLRTAVGMAGLQLQLPRLQGAFSALIGMQTTYSSLVDLKGAMHNVYAFADGKVKAFDEKYSGLLGGLNRMGDQFLERFGPGWVRTTLATFGNFYAGMANWASGIITMVPALVLGAPRIIETGISNVMTGGLGHLFHGFGQEQIEGMILGIGQQVEGINPGNLFNDHYGTSWEERLSGYSRAVGEIAPDIALTIATGGGAIALTKSLMGLARTSTTLAQFIARIGPELIMPRILSVGESITSLRNGIRHLGDMTTDRFRMSRLLLDDSGMLRFGALDEAAGGFRVADEGANGLLPAGVQRRLLDEFSVKLFDDQEWADIATTNYWLKDAMVREAGGINGVASPEALHRAQELIARHRLVEPTVSSDLLALAGDHGGALAGFEYRLKSEASLARKLGDLAIDDTPNDILRYTFVHESDGFAGSVERVTQELQSNGYDLDWYSDRFGQTGYQGINSTFSKSGVQFELQFHTPESFTMKTEFTHTPYEVVRMDEMAASPAYRAAERANHEWWADLPAIDRTPHVQWSPPSGH